MPGPHSLTNLLDSINQGRDGAFSELVDLVYEDLRRVAANRLGQAFRRRLDQLTVGPTGVVHETVLELMQQRRTPQNTGHFFAIATLLIVRVVQRYQEHKNAQKRGGGHRGYAYDVQRDAHIDNQEFETSQMTVIDAVQRVHESDPRAAEVLTLNVLLGRALPITAEMVGVSLATAERDKAKALRIMRVYLSD